MYIFELPRIRLGLGNIGGGSIADIEGGTSLYRFSLEEERGNIEDGEERVPPVRSPSYTYVVCV